MPLFHRAPNCLLLLLASAIVLERGQAVLAEPPEKAETAQKTDAVADVDDGTFAISPPVICSQIVGYEDYEKRPNSTLTKDEKFLLYFLPRHFKSAKVGKKYQASFTEDLRIRRKGHKAPIVSKDRFAEYKQSAAEPPQLLYLRNSISLKPLKPGEYELDLILHDMVGKGAPALRTVSFKIVESSYKTPENEEPERPAERPGFR